MFTTPQNVNHASFKTNTSFCTLHLSSTELPFKFFHYYIQCSLTRHCWCRIITKLLWHFFLWHICTLQKLQMNTLCSLDNTSDHHQSSLHNNTQSREDIFQQMTQFVTYSLWLGSYFPVFRKMIIDTLCISTRGQKLRRYQHARMLLFTDMWWICFKYDPGLEIKYRHSRTLELQPPD